MPGQLSSHPKKYYEQKKIEDNDDWKENYSTEDSSLTIAVESNCTGCGAKFHCQDSALPGFVPVKIIEKIIDIEKKNRRRKEKIQIDELCRRCYMLKTHNFLVRLLFI